MKENAFERKIVRLREMKTCCGTGRALTCLYYDASNSSLSKTCAKVTLAFTLTRRHDTVLHHHKGRQNMISSCTGVTSVGKRPNHTQHLGRLISPPHRRSVRHTGGERANFSLHLTPRPTTHPSGLKSRHFLIMACR